MAPRPVPVWAGWIAVVGVSAIGYCLADRRRSLWWILLAAEVVPRAASGRWSSRIRLCVITASYRHR